MTADPRVFALSGFDSSKAVKELGYVDHVRPQSLVAELCDWHELAGLLK
jgi:hypothetical protein